MPPIPPLPWNWPRMRATATLRHSHGCGRRLRRPSSRVIATMALTMLLGLVLPGSLPPAAAGQPQRVVLPITQEPLLLPAGHACAFDLLVLRDDPKATGAVTFFDDARTTVHVNASPTLVNLDTGASLDHHSTFTAVETPEPLSSTVEVTLTGTAWLWLDPGDQGPHGLVEHPGAALSVTGRQTFTVDPTTDRILTYQHSGTVVDLCQQLAP